MFRADTSCAPNRRLESSVGLKDVTADLWNRCVPHCLGFRSSVSDQSSFVKARRAHSKVDFDRWEATTTAPTLNGFDNRSHGRATVLIVSDHGQLPVRRLTPRECERLMGWPDDHTRWRADGREQSDTARYKQCGNGVVSPVAEWVGRRLRFLIEG
jgi:site-specific DNA-cytosine methylase